MGFGEGGNTKNPGILGPFQFFQQEISPEFPSDFAGISGVFGIALALGVWELRELGNVGNLGMLSHNEDIPGEWESEIKQEFLGGRNGIHLAEFSPDFAGILGIFLALGAWEPRKHGNLGILNPIFP